ncbi:hypothetical protein [Candidatus Nitrospira neomarina]|uniref:Uncharacterized protein n=1 Tax=Candidatus Nitrospira neomarina TaxID=3020899 RepID=A0AA96JW99_9BACT|nr:hypothetical protein [Candidatus Nitrospira neomarina]WNM62263.1 hypothetical protein PQG83_00530 [Candidatus Nitrospira neomarina]
MKILSAFTMILVLTIPGIMHAQQKDKTPVSFQLMDFEGNKTTLKELLEIKDFSKPGVLVLMTEEPDDQVLSLVRTLARVVNKNKEEKGTRGAAIFLWKDEKAIAVVKKKLTGVKGILKSGNAGEVPDIYKISDADPVNVVKVVGWKNSEVKFDEEKTATELSSEDTLTDILVLFLDLLK